MLVVPFGQDVELLEERLVVAASCRLVGVFVDLGHVLGQPERHAELIRVKDHPALGFGQRFFGSVYLLFEPRPLVAEGIGRHIVALLGVQANQAHLLILQLGDQGGLGLLDFGDGLLADADQGLDGRRAALYVLGAQLDRSLPVVAGDSGLDQLGPDVGAHRTLAAVDAAGAEEVGVLAAVAALGDGEGQALAALAAEHRTAQVVAAMLRALTGDPLFVKPRLHGIKGVLVNQRFMTAGEGLLVGGAALVDDPSGVVRVAEDALQRGRADLVAPRVTPSAAGPQAEPVQLFGQLRHGVLAAGVKVEGYGDEVLAVRVGGDAGHLAAVRQHFRRIDVADARPAVSAAVFSLLEYAAFDALAGQHRLVLVVGDDHPLVEEARGGVLPGHRLGDGYESSAGLVDQLAGLPMVNGVPRPTGERPDDHVVHAGRSVLVAVFQLIEHFEEAGALVQIDVGALAGIGELGGYLGVELSGLVAGGLALRADRQPVRVVVRLHLAFGGNPQVDKGPFGLGFGGV